MVQSLDDMISGLCRRALPSILDCSICVDDGVPFSHCLIALFSHNEPGLRRKPVKVENITCETVGEREGSKQFGLHPPYLACINNSFPGTAESVDTSISCIPPFP